MIDLMTAENNESLAMREADLDSGHRKASQYFLSQDLDRLFPTEEEGIDRMLPDHRRLEVPAAEMPYP